MPSAVQHFLRPRWFVVALVVGGILNLINQYEALLYQPADINYFKLLLTFLVPYLVSSISAWMEVRQAMRN